MKPVPHGEPYAGKLHVRFDEGAGVPYGGVPLYSTPHGNNQPVLSFATFAFFAAKHQSRVGAFSVERGNAFYTIYTAIICVWPRSGCFRAGAETGAYPPRQSRAARFACRAAIRLPDEQREEPCAARSQEVERWLQLCIASRGLGEKSCLGCEIANEGVARTKVRASFSLDATND